ncbi:hypothetical protein BsWGS_21762 [Bradybaena similaris]
MLPLLVFAAAVVTAEAGLCHSVCSPPPGTSTHDFISRDINDQHFINITSLTAGKLTLIVNVASFCGLTQHYHQMNALLSEFPPSSFTILAFPCNQFGHQEPGNNGTEILNGLRYVRPGNGFQPHPNLHMMLKTEVNGDQEHDLYGYLKTSCPQPDTAKFYPGESFWDPILVNDITWNFEKFLVSPSGVPLYRFRPKVEPFDLKYLMKSLLNPAENLTAQTQELTLLLHRLEESWIKRDGQ